MNDRRFENLPLILETPLDCQQADIDLLYSFVAWYEFIFYDVCVCNMMPYNCDYCERI